MQEEKVIAKRYRVTALLGRGGFGDVFKAVDTLDGGRPVVVKTEKKVPDDKGVLIYESKILQYLGGVAGLPRVFQTGAEEKFNFFVMDYCGFPLSAIHKVCLHKFDQKVVLADPRLPWSSACACWTSSRQSTTASSCTET